MAKPLLIGAAILALLMLVAMFFFDYPVEAYFPLILERMHHKAEGLRSGAHWSAPNE